MKLSYEGSRNVVPQGRDAVAGRFNFFLGDDTSGWHTGVRGYKEVLYPALYEGIDLLYRFCEGGLKYEFVLHPGCDPGKISIHVEGQASLLAGDQDMLEIMTQAGSFFDAGLVAFYSDGPHELVECAFELRGTERYGFELDRWDGMRTLVIDPFVYSTFLGGDAAGDDGWDIKVDASGNAYVTGDTYSSVFPTTPGAYQEDRPGKYDIFVTKIDPSGSSLVFSTYIGGSKSEGGHSIDIDDNGNAYIGGTTESDDFPTTDGVLQEDFAGGESDGLVCKLSSTGGELVYASYFGTSGEDYAMDVDVDDDGNLYLATFTDSGDLPTTTGAFQESSNGLHECLVCKVNSDCSGLVYSTYLGGQSSDVVYGLAVDSDGSAYVCGVSPSSDFPTTDGAYKRSKSGPSDAFVTKLAPDGSSLEYSTLLGGGNTESALDIAVDPSGVAYIAGDVYSQDFPTTRGAFQRSPGGTYPLDLDGFVARISADGSSLASSTYLGGRQTDREPSLALAPNGTVHVTGATQSPDFPTTEVADNTSSIGIWDIFLTVLSPDLKRAHYSSYLGGSGHDHPNGVTVDGDGYTYLTGSTTSSNFPFTPNVDASGFDPTGLGDCFVCKVTYDFEPPKAEAGPDQIVDQHETVTFDGTGSRDDTRVANWTWTFVYDDEPVTLLGPRPQHTFHTAGEYTVTLSVSDEGWLGDVDQMNVTVRDITPPVANAGPDKVVDQFGTFTLDGRGSTDNVGVVSWNWTLYFRGEVYLYRDGRRPRIELGEVGIYTVVLNVTDAAGNWATDTVNVTIRDTTRPVADPGSDREVDQHETVAFDGSRSRDNVGVVNWTWSFRYGGGTITLYGPTPTFVFDLAGRFDVTLTVRDAENNTGSAGIIITVRDITPPVADVGQDITVGQMGRVTLDGSASEDDVGIVAWNWSFSYGGEVVKLHGETAEYTFEEAGVYEVTLVVYDEVGLSSADTLRVFVLDTTAPWADAGQDQTVDQHEELRLNGSASTDNVGIVDWRWSIEHGNGTVFYEGATPMVTLDVAGEYLVRLNVSDAAGNNATDTVTVTVLDIEPPMPVVDMDLVVDQFDVVTLDATPSEDNVGIAGYVWSFTFNGTDHVLDGPIHDFWFDLPVVVDINLNVTDTAGNWAELQLVLTVLDAVRPTAVPPANITVEEGASLTLVGSESFDNVGVVRWVWRFVYGGADVELEGEWVEFTFEEPGTYSIELVVVDGEGNIGRTTFTVTVEEKPTWLWFVLAIVVLAAAAGAGACYWRRGRE